VTAPDALAQPIAPTGIAYLSDDWEALVSAGLTVRGAGDRSKWTLGYLAMKVEEKYGHGSLKKFATELKMESASKLYDYHRASKYYPFLAYEEYSALTWSHFREAMRAKSVDQSFKWLNSANDNDWPVAALGRAITKELGKPVPPQRATFEATYRQAGETFVTLNMVEVNRFVETLSVHAERTITVTLTWTHEDGAR